MAKPAPPPPTEARDERREWVPRGNKSLGGDGRKKPTSVVLSDGDKEMVAYIQERLSVGMGEAIRTAIRVYAAMLKKP